MWIALLQPEPVGVLSHFGLFSSWRLDSVPCIYFEQAEKKTLSEEAALVRTKLREVEQELAAAQPAVTAALESLKQVRPFGPPSLA